MSAIDTAAARPGWIVYDRPCSPANAIIAVAAAVVVAAGQASLSPMADAAAKTADDARLDLYTKRRLACVIETAVYTTHSLQPQPIPSLAGVPIDVAPNPLHHINVLEGQHYLELLVD